MSDPLLLKKERTRSAVLHVWSSYPIRNTPVRTPESSLDEAVSLAGAIALDVVYKEALKLSHPSPATLMGGGTVDRLKVQWDASSIGLVVVDHALTPVQQRNLEKAWQCKVIDRTGLILEIFGERAQTREGQLQVELAALDFQRSRLVRSWTHLERQRGGMGFLGGPGESQLELDKRLIEDRMIRIRKDLEKVRQTRSLQRQTRKRNEIPVVALVGYTNAGKSTLFNTLTQANVLAKDMLFATLDPTMRRIKLPSGRLAILSDTVGFISSLPHQLVSAFHATLEEVSEADVILHVRDCIHEETVVQKNDVEQTLKELGIDPHGDRRIIEVLNKADLLDAEEREAAKKSTDRQQMILLSALTGDGVDVLLKRLDDVLFAAGRVSELAVGVDDGEGLAWLYRHGRVLRREDKEDRIELHVTLSEADEEKWSRRLSSVAGR